MLSPLALRLIPERESFRRSEPTARVTVRLRFRACGLILSLIILTGCTGSTTTAVAEAAEQTVTPKSTSASPAGTIRPTSNSVVARPIDPLKEWPVEAEPRAWKYIVVHHSATSFGNVQQIDAAHRQQLDANGVPWRGVGYHFVIGNGDGMPDGAIEPTFRWNEQTNGAHAGVGSFNELGVGICLIGNFEEAQPTAKQLAAARKLVAALKSGFHIDNDRVLRHGDLKPTACPGVHFSLDAITGPRSPSRP